MCVLCMMCVYIYIYTNIYIYICICVYIYIRLYNDVGDTWFTTYGETFGSIYTFPSPSWCRVNISGTSGTSTSSGLTAANLHNFPLQCSYVSAYFPLTSLSANESHAVPLHILLSCPFHSQKSTHGPIGKQSMVKPHFWSLIGRSWRCGRSCLLR